MKHEVPGGSRPEGCSGAHRGEAPESLKGAWLTERPKGSLDPFLHTVLGSGLRGQGCRPLRGGSRDLLPVLGPRHHPKIARTSQVLQV